MAKHEKHYEFHVLEESLDTQSSYHALVLHYGDHKPPQWERGVATLEVVEHIPCGPTIMGVYASINLVDRYMIYMETRWDIGSIDISKGLNTGVHTQ